MADSKNTKTGNSVDEFAEDLDGMLNEDESVVGELVDDDDVIDKLLMDDSFDPVEETSSDDISSEKNNSDLEESGVKTMAAEEKNTTTSDEVDADEFDVDAMLSSAAEEVDEFAEEASTEGADNVLEDIDGLVDSTPVEGDVEQEVGDDSADKDFLMADFDISSDEDELLGSDEGDELEVEELDETEEVGELEVEDSNNDSPAEQGSTNDNSEIVADFKNEINAQNNIISGVGTDLTQAKDAIAELKEQLIQVVAENVALQAVVTELTGETSKKDETANEEIEALQRDHRKLKKAIKESEGKVPVIVYVVMGIAILGLLVAGGLGSVGYGAKTDVEVLTEVVSTLEEEIEIITTKDATSDINEIKFKINALKIKDEGVDEQLLSVMSDMQKPKPNSLQAVVDDLTIQNEHAQKAIEKLLAAVGTLEQNAVVTAEARKKVKRVRKKVVVKKIEWVVNLVSFKQEWYAKRKAEEFKKKGIPARVDLVKVNGETWFRLRVKGFKSKYEAAAYAVKVKKIINLSSVWVTKL